MHSTANAATASTTSRRLGAPQRPARLDAAEVTCWPATGPEKTTLPAATGRAPAHRTRGYRMLCPPPAPSLISPLKSRVEDSPDTILARAGTANHGPMPTIEGGPTPTDELSRWETSGLTAKALPKDLVHTLGRTRAESPMRGARWRDAPRSR